jgi:methionyl-tRNA formyltransferase
VRILFWGTPDFAVPSLAALLGEGYDVVGVVTQPDRPAGRGRELRPSPVRVVAESEGIPVFTPDRPRGEAFLADLEALAPDLSVVVAYGHILRPEVLELPRLGSVNVHASLLPALRGAAPIQWAILSGLPETGVTIMRMSAGMDEGPILHQRRIPLTDEDTAAGLFLRLAELGAEALLQTLPLLAGEGVEAVPQDPSGATYAPKIDREMAHIDWTRGARDVGCWIRGMDSAPGAWTLWRGAPLKLFEPRVWTGDHPTGSPSGAPAGTVLVADPVAGTLVVACGEGALSIGAVQPAGKRRMTAGEWLRGGAISPEERLGE